ncbi:MAG: GMP synthase (glutamine-hydrolyzing), partial [Kiritimatiellae bacterium]|nr:GMP synthase (glutamine-hydrolyzing) [Kiritimatiellia bacterium]
DQANQYFAVLTGNRSVGVSDDARTYAYTVALRAVKTSDFMTASFVKLPMDLLESVSERITASVPQINRVVYDITSKPPSTIEWE